MFGLYATTGRAASFLAPGLFALFSGLFSDRIGIVGIALVLGMGALAMIGVSSPAKTVGEGLRIRGVGHVRNILRVRGVGPFGA